MGEDVAASSPNNPFVFILLWGQQLPDMRPRAVGLAIMGSVSNQFAEQAALGGLLETEGG